MKTIFAALFALALASLGIGSENLPKEGECWSYSARKGEESSFLVIRKIEVLPKLGEVIHISLFDLRVKSAAHPKGFVDQISHLPIAGANVRASLKVKLSKEAPVVDWEDGYRTWRKAFEAGRGGIYTIPVGDCVGAVEAVINGRN